MAVARPRRSAVLTARALNRALLARQLLLRRSGDSPLAVLAHVTGQEAPPPPAPPYIGLWSRVPDFDADEVPAPVPGAVRFLPAGHRGRPGRPAFVTAEAWRGARPPGGPSPAALVHRYLAAFGPATLADIEKRCGPAGVAASAVRELAGFTDEAGRALFDLPGAPRPAPDVPAPVRFLPAGDAVLLAHADPSRLLGGPFRRRLVTRHGHWPPVFLVDGFVGGCWEVRYEGSRVLLVLTPFGTLAGDERADVVEEGCRLLRFLRPETDQLDLVIRQDGAR
ncbi:DNA glycosylase AlkZ-like family protein [Streptomyces sp. NPDC053542]|uniref:DNA glycosylase AlkZ-like family protein n=1 Tax=Streptomyces sp. NPDC053542 TaxID=3365710 RepID=UPI0037CE7A83